MNNFIQVLQFEDIFPEENKEEPIEYLKKISKENLLKLIGFCNTTPLPNYQNFFSNLETKNEIRYRVDSFLLKSQSAKKKIETISPYSILRIAEIIFSNQDILLNKKLISTEAEELYLFKAFLTINSEYNNYDHKFQNGQLESFIDFHILQSFQLSELCLHKNDKGEFAKLMYATIHKLEELLKFLDIKGLHEIKKKLINSFNVESEEKLLYEMKYLFGILAYGKFNNSFTYNLDGLEHLDLLQSILLTKIEEDEDFTYLKKYPIYLLNDNTFSVINYFYAIDLFYRSTKFRLNEIYKLQPHLFKEKGDFSSYFNKNFSENFLMKNVLDNIFTKKYFIGKKYFEIEQKNEPDYYIRYNNTIYLFENKDVMVNKKIKAARNIQPILDFLKQKFYLNESKNKKVGIHQLINSIEQIVNNNFAFDDFVNTKTNFEIFPILIVHDRIFQSLGINFILNKWFKEELKNRLDDKLNMSRIHNLTVIDIDTLIIWQPHIKDKINAFKQLLLKHTSKIDKTKFNHRNISEFVAKMSDLLYPISERKTPFFIDKKEFLKKFDTLRNKS